MKHLSLLIIVVLTCSCTAQRKLVREASESCSSPAVDCTPELAAIAELDVLRTNGKAITVDCGVTHKIDVAYRQSCEKRLSTLAEALSTRASSELSTVSVTDMTLLESQTCIDTFISGREAADCEFYSVSAKIPLRWRR